MATDTPSRAHARRAAVIEFIDRYITEWGHPPTVREIASGLCIPSTSSVQRELEWLRAHGALTWRAGKPRTFAVNPAAGQIIKEA